MGAQATASLPGVRTGPRIQGRLATLAVMAVTAVAIVGAALLVNGPAESTDGLTPVNLVGSPTGPAPIVGEAAPPLAATALDGSTVDLSAYAGSPIWVTFGASWCQPCRAENPDIAAAYAAHRDDGLVVIQVFMDEDAATISAYAERVGLDYVKVPDPTGRLSIEYRILGIPSHFFIDSTGVLRQTRVGTLDRAGMDAALAALVP
jgi:cytochrome c biogenesis protein CcmG, thiol:disulfide interchange protein DsbE